MSKPFSQPLSPFIINQKFGENNACVTTDGTNKVINCDGLNPPKGYKSLYGKAGHTGLDLGAKHGQEVYCACEGTVYFIDTQEKSGLDVRVESIVDGVTYHHIYEHLLGYSKKVGDTVKTGELIGWADNTGYSSGNHLHFQVEQLIGKNWVKVDPLQLMTNDFARNILLMNDVIKYAKEVIALLLDRSATKLRK